MSLCYLNPDQSGRKRIVKMCEKMDSTFNPEAIIEEFEALSTDADRVQTETLKKILEDNCETEYLLQWGLDGRSDPDSFKACVPVVTHKDLEPYIQRIADGETKTSLSLLENRYLLFL